MIQGEKTTLRALCDDDVERLRNWRNHPDIFPYHFTCHHTSQIEQRKWYESYTANQYYFIYIIENEAREAIGYTILKDLDHKNRQAEIGLYLDSKNQGKGYGSDAFRSLIRYGFQELNLHRLYLQVIDFNEKAIKMYEKLGFHIDGRLRESYFTQKRYCDIVVMSILESEFAA